MHATRISTTLLLGLLGLSACDPEFDEQAFDEDGEIEEPESSETDPSLPPSSTELEPLDEIEATSSEQAAVSCSLGLPDNIDANWDNFNSSVGAFSGITGGNYTIEVDRSGSDALYWYQIFVHGQDLGWEVNDATFGPFYASPGDPLELDIQAWSTAKLRFPRHGSTTQIALSRACLRAQRGSCIRALGT